MCVRVRERQSLAHLDRLHLASAYGPLSKTPCDDEGLRGYQRARNATLASPAIAGAVKPRIVSLILSIPCLFHAEPKI